ncbi:MAG: GTPase [Nanoarchaeota archaeon]
MASTNQSPFYMQAEKKFLLAQNNEEKLRYLEEMIRECPKHKSAEKMLANLKTRYIKLKEKIERTRRVSKGASKKGIKKEELQAVIVGRANSGKSSLLSALTNARPKISDALFATTQSQIGMMNFKGVNIQMIEVPAIESEYYDRGLVHTADLILILVDRIEQIDEIRKRLGNTNNKTLVVCNKIDLLDANERRRLEARLKSHKLNFMMISAKTGENFSELKEKIFEGFGKLRIFTKEPGKPRSEKPVILESNSTVKDVAEKILKGFSKNVMETRIWGPSSKFPEQKVGLAHLLKDLDVVEFKTR